MVAFEKQPELVSMEPPNYPEDARAKGVEGTVHVRVLVGEDGLVRKATISKSIPLLDESAIGAARTAVFKPGLLEHKPVAVWMVIPIEYKLP